MPYNQIAAVTGRQVNPYAGISEAIKTEASYLPQLYALKRQEELEKKQLDLSERNLALREEKARSDIEQSKFDLATSYNQNKEAERLAKLGLGTDILGTTGLIGIQLGALKKLSTIASGVTSGSIAASLAGTSIGPSAYAGAGAAGAGSILTGTAAAVLPYAAGAAVAITGLVGAHKQWMKNPTYSQYVGKPLERTLGVRKDETTAAQTVGLMAAGQRALSQDNTLLAANLYQAYRAGEHGKDLGTGETVALQAAAQDALAAGDTATAAVLYQYWRAHH